MTFYPTLAHPAPSKSVHQLWTPLADHDHEDEPLREPSAPLYGNSRAGHIYETPRMPGFFPVSQQQQHLPPPQYNPSIAADDSPPTTTAGIVVGASSSSPHNIQQLHGSQSMRSVHSHRSTGSSLEGGLSTNGVRELVLAKDQHGKIGVRLTSVDRGIFVQFVARDSQAARCGVRFGDQVLEINGSSVFGVTPDKAMTLIAKEKNFRQCTLTLRDRPSQRVIALVRDQLGDVGVIQRDGRVVDIKSDSSAAREGLLLNHQVVEVDGHCVVGMKTKEIDRAMSFGGGAGQEDETLYLTIMPIAQYQQLISRIDLNLFKRQHHGMFDVMLSSSGSSVSR